LRRAFGTAALVVLVMAPVVLAGRAGAGYLHALRSEAEALGALAPLAFIGAYALAVVALVPAAPLTMVGGAVFGVTLGTAYVLVAATLGCAAAFLAARTLARGLVERRVGSDPRFAAIDRAIAERGRGIVFLIRLSPLFPFTAINYALGLTRIRFADYLVASVGMLPGSLLYAWLGALGEEALAVGAGGRDARALAEYALLLLGFTGTLAATALVARIARRALAEVTHA
jgi:uncharacterized membrane protein YdjX (TVP38/TMEM64 family)